MPSKSSVKGLNPVVTYYFGAGASIGNMPLMKEMPHFIKDIVSLMNNLQANGLLSSIPNTELFLELKEALTSLSLIVEDYETIDKLISEFGNDESELTNYKHLLAFCFEYWQQISNPNKRIQSIISQIFTKRYNQLTFHRGPFNIISWNYDCEVERNVRRYFKEYNSMESLDNFFQKDNLNSDWDGEIPISLFKMNGSARISNDPMSILDLCTAKTELRAGLINSYLKYVDLKGGKFSHNIRFAWEKSNDSIEMITAAKKALSYTDYLIIVGYSFPIDNIEFDMELIRALSQNVKVFIQCGDESDKIKSRFLEIVNSSFPQFEAYKQEVTLNRPIIDYSKESIYYPIRNQVIERKIQL